MSFDSRSGVLPSATFFPDFLKWSVSHIFIRTFREKSACNSPIYWTTKSSESPPITGNPIIEQMTSSWLHINNCTLQIENRSQTPLHSAFIFNFPCKIWTIFSSLSSGIYFLLLVIQRSYNEMSLLVHLFWPPLVCFHALMSLWVWMLWLVQITIHAHPFFLCHPWLSLLNIYKEIQHTYWRCPSVFPNSSSGSSINWLFDSFIWAVVHFETDGGVRCSNFRRQLCIGIDSCWLSN